MRKKAFFPKTYKYSERCIKNMTTQDKSIVGKKGEILPKKHLRIISGISPGDEILIEAYPGEIIVKKIYSVKELLEMPIIAERTVDGIEIEIEEESKKQEEMTD